MTVLFVGTLAVVTVLGAQEVPQASPAAKASTATAPAEAPPPAAAAEGKAPPAAQPDRKPGTSPGRFEPSEKVRADFDVSFPVDI